MISLSTSSSMSSLHSPSQHSLSLALPSPAPSASRSISSASGSASSSYVSLNGNNEDYTITARRLSPKGKRESQEDLHLLAVSTRITELSYAISDIETRIFEIQELRHKSQSGDASAASRVIDQSLAALDERLKTVAKGVKSVNGSLEPLLEASKTPTIAQTGEQDESAAILRKHAAMISEWEALRKESDILREELKEDKWLTVFRTVTDQADGMMSSLEKAINRCQDFIRKIHKRGPEDSISRSSSMSSLTSDSSPISFEVYTSLLESYEAKKKHYVPATAKVLSVIDKGVQDRVTKNGECLRRHAECKQRWQKLQDRITRTDRDMDTVRRLLLTDATPSEAGSSVSVATSKSPRNNLLTPPDASRSPKMKGLSASSTLSRSISPFRKLARKLKHASSKSPTPATPPLPKPEPKAPSSEPTRTLKHRASLFNLMSGQPSPLTPDRPMHKHAQSLTPDSSPLAQKVQPLSTSTLKGRRPVWNSSTRVEDEGPSSRTVKGTPRRASNATAYRFPEDCSPHSSVPSTPYKRSLSRSSMASSRPWSPVTSSGSTAHSSNPPLSSLYRPPSRAQAPSMPVTPTAVASPRSRPKTPSQIPAPSKHWRSISTSPSDASWDGENTSSIMQRAFSPTRAETPSAYPPRPPSRSMIPLPLPSLQVSASSRPSSAMSVGRPDSSMSFRGSAFRAQTPDAFRSTPRPSAIHQPRLPPSSFKDTAAPRTPNTRPPSRTGAATPGADGKGPTKVYVPLSSKDPLDVEFAAIVNSIPHGLVIERLDPPLRTVPREGEEISAQYAFSTSLSRKQVTCKLTTLARAGRDRTTKKVMCRVGGGWQDLQMYIANRQMGM